MRSSHEIELEQADDDCDRSQHLNERIKRVEHDEHATEGTTQNNKWVSGSPLQFHNWILHDPFYMSRRGRSWNKVCRSLPRTTLNKSTPLTFPSILIVFTSNLLNIWTSFQGRKQLQRRRDGHEYTCLYYNYLHNQRNYRNCYISLVQVHTITQPL